MHPDYQGRSLGHVLLDFILSDGVQHGDTNATLWTNTAAFVARRLFESHGFTPTGREDVDEFGRSMILLRAVLTAG